MCFPGRLVMSRRGPDQASAVVVDDDRQIAVPTLVRDLVDPSPPQAGEPIVQRIGVSHARARTDPTVRHAIGINRGHCALRCLSGQPGHRQIEGPRLSRSRPGPGHIRHHISVLRAKDAWRVGLHHYLHGAHIQCLPSAWPTGVVPAATALTDPGTYWQHRGRAAPGRSEPAPPTSNSTASTAISPTPKKVCHTLVLRTPFLRSCDPGLQAAQNVCENGVSPFTAPHSNPHDRFGVHQFLVLDQQFVHAQACGLSTAEMGGKF